MKPFSLMGRENWAINDGQEFSFQETLSHPACVKTESLDYAGRKPVHLRHANPQWVVRDDSWVLES